MKSDSQIQKDVIEELKWQPFLNASEIGVAVKNGIVTLSGHVDSYAKKLQAEKVAKKIEGVRAVAEEIGVGISPSFKRTDTDIAEAVLNAIKWHSGIPENKLKVKVEDGVVYLEGEVEWAYQRNNAKSVIEHLVGVRSVINSIILKPKLTAGDVTHKINAAFQRSAMVDAAKISATVIGQRVILNGTVRSVTEKDDAEEAAWNAPGVVIVENRLKVETPQHALVD